MKFIHFTDPHLVVPGEKIYGLDPLARLDACIDDINANQSDAAFCVVTGDLADLGEREAYAGLRQSLRRLNIPCHLLIGNHDHRERYVEAFPDAPRDENGFVQLRLATAMGEFLFLDTLDQVNRAGFYCEQRLAWLEARLAQAHSRPVYLFMHHPPFDIGIHGLDEIRLANADEFAALTGRFGNIRHLFFGHVHRPVSGSWRGIAFSTLRATNHQVVMNFAPGASLRYVDEPPAYAVVFVDDDKTIVHTHDYLPVARLIEREDK